MWFKNLQVYRFTRPFELTAEQLETQLEACAFTPCGSQDISRFGWTRPFGKLGHTLTHAANGQILLCALRWEAIDWVGNTVQVSRAKVVGVIKTTKTRAGTRTIELTSEALAALTSQKRFTFMRGEYVFDDPKLNQPWAGADAIRKKAWLYTLKRSGVRYRHLYQTRHTFATANISRGCNLFWLSTQMGHKGPEMLFRHYGSYLAEYDGQTAKAPILIQNPTGK
ncbi:hypothetical protein KAM346_17470 [Aeromonas caviae]|nr:hypothetical protein KAM346_17470 [Aeromonas caviae]